jgi:hypothetical protein
MEYALSVDMGRFMSQLLRTAETSVWMGKYGIMANANAFLVVSWLLEYARSVQLEHYTTQLL